MVVRLLQELFLNHCMPNLDLKPVRLVAGKILRIRLSRKNVNNNNRSDKSNKKGSRSSDGRP